MATQYSKLKVAELKATYTDEHHTKQELLKERDLPVSGLKADLVARLAESDAASPATAKPADQPAPIADIPDADAAVETVADGGKEGNEAGGMGDSLPSTDGLNLAAKRALEDEAVEEEVKRVKRDEEMADAVPPAAEKDSALPPPAPAPTFDSAPALGGDLPNRSLALKEEDGGRPADLYLDTINRAALDFDFERLCSVTLSHNHIYACLVCGKYFQGRGKSTPAYAHALNEDHHVYINLDTRKVYVLPDGYEVDDASLADIKYLLYPTFTPQMLEKIDHQTQPELDLARKEYYPGFVGLNNMKHNSYMNAVLQLLLHVPPLRDYLILQLDPSSTSSRPTSELTTRLGLLARKLWNPHAFKSQVSPHEFLQEVANASGGKFKITEQGDPLEFLKWLLNQVHRDLGGGRKPRSSIVYSAFQGEVRVDDQQIIKTGEFGTKPKFDIDREIKSTKTPFLFLALDLPPPPLFQDAVETNIIPQVPISAVLSKYDGSTTREDTQAGVLKRSKITRLPPFLIVYYKRFLSNRFLEEKNPTIVNFPLKGVDMSEYVDSAETLAAHYDLTANLSLQSSTSTGTTATSPSAEWKVHVHLRNAEKGKEDEGEKWFEVQDLNVREIEKGMVPLAETYIQIWERRTPNGKWDDLVKVDPPKSHKAKAGGAPQANGKKAEKPAPAAK
ncbi:Spindle pole body protein [Rhodotorula toruloides ATCC 204091]|uniref:BY PROTMAP: gi/342321041/gb/EGU12979.1/ Spindle pole body protein [Rhodotorula glutinis ATCC 204091] n=1 Tax=Rhodotorula toruloides TaxID=5286 RepID=A0A0K3CIS4_RHOTO|nr:Spindle pole body protein [Rhodotorula toruloides ATCC 204091]